MAFTPQLFPRLGNRKKSGGEAKKRGYERKTRMVRVNRACCRVSRGDIPCGAGSQGG